MKNDREISVPTEIWLSDVLDEITDDEMQAELRSRGISSDLKESILDALIMLKTGRVDDGIAALEREFFPRYADEAECRAAYVRAMLPGQPQMSGGIDDFITKALGMSIAAHCSGPDVEAA